MAMTNSVLQPSNVLRKMKYTISTGVCGDDAVIFGALA